MPYYTQFYVVLGIKSRALCTPGYQSFNQMAYNASFKLYSHWETRLTLDSGVYKILILALRRWK